MIDISVPFDKKQPDSAGNIHNITIDVVRNRTELDMAFQLRQDIFVNEKKIPYEKEFDGNDFTSTHILAKCDTQPAGTLRIRCFKDFAKMERLCVHPQFRKHSVAKYLLDYTQFYLIQKGYTYFIGYILSSLKDFWCARGFQIDKSQPEVKVGAQTLLPCIYQFPPQRIAQHKAKINLLATESYAQKYQVRTNSPTE